MKKYTKYDLAKKLKILPDTIQRMDDKRVLSHGYIRLPKVKNAGATALRMYRKLTKKEKEQFEKTLPKKQKKQPESKQLITNKEKLIKVRIKKIQQQLIENKLKIRAELRQQILQQFLGGLSAIKNYLKTLELSEQQIKGFAKIIEQHFKKNKEE